MPRKMATRMGDAPPLVGFSCSYTPLPLIRAAGFTPYRVLPLTGAPDQAGQLLHDNLCPHVKRLLDRALDGDLPDLAGMIFVNSCDAMRRLHDAWNRVRPNDYAILVDLPLSADESSVAFFAGEMVRLTEALESWGGRAATPEAIRVNIAIDNEISEKFTALRQRPPSGGWTTIQDLYNRAVTEPADKVLEFLRSLTSEAGAPTVPGGVPVFLFGNLLPDPEAFTLIESCGVRIAGEDLCTGSRMFPGIPDREGLSVEESFEHLARHGLSRPPCARTLDPMAAGSMSTQIVSRATACGARGVIGHVLKFCDPYLARIPALREALRAKGLPLLVLEGDTTLRSMGQHRTRVEAFVEMLD